MSYYAVGEISLTIPEDTAATIALGKEFFKDRFPWVTLTNDIVGDLLAEVAGFEITEDKKEANGVRQIGAIFNNKWGGESEGVLEELAERGAGVAGEVQGEDGYAWSYATNAGDNKLIVHDLTYIEAHKLGTLRAAEKVLTALEGVNLDALPIPGALRDALRELDRSQ